MDTLKNPCHPQVNGIFELQVTNDAKETATWTIDLKKTATVYKGKAKPKADITIIFTDTTLTDIASGKVRTRFAATLPLPSCLWMTW